MAEMHQLLCCVKGSFWGSVQKEDEQGNMSEPGVTSAGKSQLCPSLTSSQLQGGFLSPDSELSVNTTNPVPLSLLLLLSSLFLLPCDKLGPSESSCSSSCLLVDSTGFCIFKAIHPCSFFFFFFCHKSISLGLLASQYYLL